MKSIKICHISDSHGEKVHSKLIIPECDVLVHSGDIGGRTSLPELLSFLEWGEKQPAKEVLFVPGNHDIVLDKYWPNKLFNKGLTVQSQLAKQQYEDAMEMVEKSKVKMLIDKDYVFEGVKFYGSPYTPSFHKEHWAFNADRGVEINKVWAKIPGDTNVLITHGPPYGVLDLIPEKFKQTPEEDVHRGCEEQMKVIKSRLFDLKLCCFGHIHSNYGVISQAVSGSRKVLFSNGAVIDNQYVIETINPLIITI